MRYLLIFHRRLGDIVASLAAAKHLADQGHDVTMETEPAYADIFHCVDYCRWKAPAEPGSFDVSIPMQIFTPETGDISRYERFRASGKHWFDFAFDHPAIAPARWRRPVFTRTDWFRPSDYPIPPDGNYALVCTAGISQQQAYPKEWVLELARKLYGDVPILQLAPNAEDAPGFVHVKRLRDFPGLIAHARYFLSINSGPAWIAAGVRKTYHHIPQVGRAAQDNSSFPGVSIDVLPFFWNTHLRLRHWRYLLTGPSKRV
ncbi:MAG: hypothetical protein ABIO94_00635 [Opitutaceae bacterium]